MLDLLKKGKGMPRNYIPILRSPPKIVCGEHTGTLDFLEEYIDSDGEPKYYVHYHAKAFFVFSVSKKIEKPIPKSVIISSIYSVTDPLTLLKEPVIVLPCNSSGEVINGNIRRIECPECRKPINGTELEMYVRTNKENILLRREIKQLKNMNQLLREDQDRMMRDAARMVSALKD